MSIQVNDFQWEPGKNDAEYIKLLRSSRDEWQKIAQKAIAKLKALSKAQEPMVRCKNCKHRPIDHREEYNEMTGFGLEFPDSHCPCQCEDGWYNWYPDDDWYCANGERRSNE